MNAEQKITNKDLVYSLPEGTMILSTTSHPDGHGRLCWQVKDYRKALLEEMQDYRAGNAPLHIYSNKKELYRAVNFRNQNEPWNTFIEIHPVNWEETSRTKRSICINMLKHAHKFNNKRGL